MCSQSIHFLIQIVPQEYFCNVDHRGIRADKDMRPELNYPSYEYIVNQAYCRVSSFLMYTTCSLPMILIYYDYYVAE